MFTHGSAYGASRVDTVYGASRVDTVYGASRADTAVAPTAAACMLHHGLHAPDLFQHDPPTRIDDLFQHDPPTRIDDLFRDICDGVQLLCLLEVLSGETLVRHTPAVRGNTGKTHTCCSVKHCQDTYLLSGKHW